MRRENMSRFGGLGLHGVTPTIGIPRRLTVDGVCIRAFHFGDFEKRDFCFQVRIFKM
jgi:hypothetical protein